MCRLTQTALKGFLVRQFKNETECLDTTELDQDKEAGNKAADLALIGSTVSPIPQDGNMWIRSHVHPCQKRHNDIPEHEVQSVIIRI